MTSRAKNGVSFILLFLSLSKPDREVVCLEFARLSGEQKEELEVAVLIPHTQMHSFQDMFLCPPGPSLLLLSLL